MINTNMQTVAEFGNGDILVGSFLCTDKDGAGIGILTLNNADEPMEIGAVATRAEDADPFDVPVMFTFSNIKSLDVVIDHLNTIRSNMEAFEKGELDMEEFNEEN